MIEQIIARLGQAAGDDSVRAVVLKSAAPKVFCAGVDLGFVSGASRQDIRRTVHLLYVELADVQRRLNKPSIAAVEGAARAGGMTLAVSCDLIVAGADASFGYPEINIGLIPAIHFALLPRLVGTHRAFELLFDGAPIDAREAARIGLVNRVAGDVVGEARELADRMAAKPPHVMRLGREAFHRLRAPELSGLIEEAVEGFCAVAEGPEAQEGLAAFAGKRPPRW
jgi:enoyl-CoA hydratase/carnithine racemase